MRRRLLVTHFLRRFLDNDLISPHADRHQVLAVLFATLLTSGTFLSVLVSIKYLFRPLQSRGWTLMVSLDDTFLWTGLSMIVMGAVAIGSWDALSLDGRDTEILGTLPIPRRTLVGAQLGALALFAAGFTVVLNAVPGVLAPLIRVSRLPIGGAGLLTYISAQAAVTIVAGLWGFVAVLTVREGLRAVLGPSRFARVSAIVQGGLVVLLATSLLLLPVLSADVERRWLASSASIVAPPLWFVGLHETLAGDVLVRLPPRPVAADAPARTRILAFEARMIDRYRDRRPAFDRLGRVALIALAAVFVMAGLACAWNNRKLPELTTARTRPHSHVQLAVARFLRHTLVRAPVARAGFLFTLQTLARSVPHRVALATTCGIAFAAAAVSMQAIDLSGGAGLTPPRGVFAMQTWVLIVLVAGFRHATRMPADLRATSTFVLARSGDDRPFVAGVKRAGVVAVGCPAVALLFPVHLVVMGPGLACAHAVCGGLMVLVLMELLFLHSRGLPFVSRYEPTGNVMAAAPIAALLALGAVWAVASAERLALADNGGTLALWSGLAITWAALAALNRWSPTDPGVLDPDTPLAGAVQPFVLND